MEHSGLFSPVRTRRAFEAVCDQIRTQVARGTYAPGDRLPGEKELAERFKVSRSAVREAIRSLQMAGVVEAQTGVLGGWFVSRGSPQGLTQAVQDLMALGEIPVRDITRARIELTAVAIRLACENAAEEDFAAIEEDIARYAEAARPGEPLRDSVVIIRFYHLLATATHNRVIVMLVDALSEVVRAVLARIDPVPQDGVVKVRRKVLRHLRERDADKATATLTRHLNELDAYIEARTAEQSARRAGPG
jgi:DNA-binding FadR family transcriptional regulator